jgi:hypothetical protein
MSWWVHEQICNNNVFIWCGGSVGRFNIFSMEIIENSKEKGKLKNIFKKN